MEECRIYSRSDCEKQAEYKKSKENSNIETFIFQVCKFSDCGKILNSVLLREYQKWKTNVGKELSENDVHRENFIKFLSDSRDWAFTYIEDVQNGLTKFVEEIDPSINYFSDFSTMSEGNPLHNEMKIISNAYKDLKKFLPENVEDK